jgi:hypothetical protein
MDALFLVVKKVLKQDQIFPQHVHGTVAHNILMKKIVTVVVFRHSEIKHQSFVGDLLPGFDIFAPKFKFQDRNKNYNILIQKFQLEGGGLCEVIYLINYII